MSWVGNEKNVDDPVMVNGKFVRNVGSHPSASLYEYIYMKDADKDLVRRTKLALRVGTSLGVTVGVCHLATFGRDPKFASKLEPIYKIAYCWAGGVAATLLHAGTVSACSQLQGGSESVLNWTLGGAVAGSFIFSIVRKTPIRAGYIYRVPGLIALACAAFKVAVIYDKPVHGPPTTTYGVQAVERNLGPRYFDTINPYRKQEEYYLEKFL